MKILHLKMYVISVLIYEKSGGKDYREIFVIALNLDLAKKYVSKQFKGNDFEITGDRQSIQTHVVVLDDDTTKTESHIPF